MSDSIVLPMIPKILTDIGPVLGTQVARVLATGDGFSIANGYLEPGMELLTKPFSMDALAAKVGQMMRPTDAA